MNRILLPQFHDNGNVLDVIGQKVCVVFVWPFVWQFKHELWVIELCVERHFPLNGKQTQNRLCASALLLEIASGSIRPLKCALKRLARTRLSQHSQESLYIFYFSDKTLIALMNKMTSMQIFWLCVTEMRIEPNIMSYWLLHCVEVFSRQERAQGLRYTSRMRGPETQEWDEEQQVPCVSVTQWVCQDGESQHAIICSTGLTDLTPERIRRVSDFETCLSVCDAVFVR